MNPPPPASPTPTDAPDPRMQRTYIRAGVLFLPTFLAWSFCGAFLLPQIQQFWKGEALAQSKAQLTMDLSSLLLHTFSWLVAAVPVLVIIFEFRWPEWAKHRNRAMTIVVAAFHALMLASIVMLVVAICQALPFLAKGS